MPITPDTKSWTWVIEKPCPECGFDASTFEATDVAGLLRAQAAQWPVILQRSDARRRPDETTWSPLEYGAHVRDVYRLFDYRLGLMLTQGDPTYPNWDQDETAVRDRYSEQDPIVVGEELVAAASQFGDALDAVRDDQWQRTGHRSDGASFTVESFSKYFLHDSMHHLWDVKK
jgi:hypothetical protein